MLPTRSNNNANKDAPNKRARVAHASPVHGPLSEASWLQEWVELARGCELELQVDVGNGWLVPGVPTMEVSYFAQAAHVVFHFGSAAIPLHLPISLQVVAWRTSEPRDKALVLFHSGTIQASRSHGGWLGYTSAHADAKLIVGAENTLQQLRCNIHGLHWLRLFGCSQHLFGTVTAVSSDNFTGYSAAVTLRVDGSSEVWTCCVLLSK
jgi:hypothetical protein